MTDIHDNAPVRHHAGHHLNDMLDLPTGPLRLVQLPPRATAGLEQLDVRAVKWAAGEL